MNVPERRKCVTKCEVTFFIIAGILILGGAALVVSRFAQKSATWDVQDYLVIRPNSELVHAWRDPELPVYMKFYVFNVTNADEIAKGGKPKLTEHGPYTYKLLSPRFDIKFYENDTVSFRNNNTLHFDRNMSTGSENDTFFHINIPLVTVSEKLEEMSDPMSSWLKKSGILDKVMPFLNKEELVTPHTVKEIIFGYEESMFKIISDIKSLFGEKFDPTFGPFHGFNNSDDGLFLVDTGKSNFSNFNAIQRWNGLKELPYWSDKYANMINGTDGTFLKPSVRKSEARYFYFPQMRRSVKLEYEADTEFKKVKTYRYHFADDLLKNASLDSSNAGFCVPRNNCLESGLLYAGSYGNQSAPTFLSLPHFYMGSQSLKDGVVGLKPNKAKHDSFFHVEPVTGAVLIGQRRLQINVHVKGGNFLKEMKNVRPVYFPYFWMSGESTASDKIANNLYKALKFVNLVGYSGYLVIVIGFITLIGTLIRLACRRKRKVGVNGEEPLIPSTSSAVDT